MTKKTKAPAPAKSPGRPALKTGVQTVPMVVRLTTFQRDKLGRLGGAGWIRERIDKARDPGPKD